MTCYPNSLDDKVQAGRRGVCLTRTVRAGFTLVELLVVIAIMGVLIGLLMPAVQKVREAANRISCQNNLKQIGLAMHNYQDARLSLPPGYCASGPYVDGTTDTSPGWGWATYILPYMEQDNLYDQFTLNQPVENSPGIQTILKGFICPSDIPLDAPFTVPNAFGVTVTTAAPCSYAACCGGDESDTADPTGKGVFYRNSKTRLTDITDGTSETILVGERACANANGIWAGAINNGVVVRGPYNRNPGNSTEPAPCLVLAHCHLNNTVGDTDGGLDDFSSRHIGGSNILFADGAVHFIQSVPTDNPDGSYTPDSLIFQAMGTRANGEVVPGDWYP
jgi:prepilin-type N-terminal cleavage/methylation domain-containing protein/prepilin-type processing-associated H-X9-DG protein